MIMETNLAVHKTVFPMLAMFVKDKLVVHHTALKFLSAETAISTKANNATTATRWAVLQAALLTLDITAQLRLPKLPLVACVAMVSSRLTSSATTKTKSDVLSAANSIPDILALELILSATKSIQFVEMESSKLPKDAMMETLW